MVITDSTIRNSFYTTVYNIIKVASSTIETSTSVSILGGYPDIDAVTFPCVSIMPINVNEDTYTVDTDHNVSTKNILLNVMLFSTKNKQIDILADSVSNALRTNTFAGAYLTNVGEADNIIFANDNKVKSKTLTFTYSRR